jgi:integrase
MAQCPRCRVRQKVANKTCKCGEKLDAAKRSGRVRYWISFRLPGGKQRSEPVGFSIDMARDADGKRRGQKREGRIFDILPDGKKTLAELSEWFQELEKIKALAMFSAIKAHLKLIKADLGDRPANSLLPEDIENLQVQLKEKGLSASYIDQVIDTARYMITKAFDNDLIGGDCLKPFRKVKGVLKRGANARQRVLTPKEYRRLFDACPVHLRGIVSLGFWSGMRRAEILGLTWDQVDLPGRMIRLRSQDTKEGLPKNVPLTKGMRDLLLTLPARGVSEAVFTYRGNPLGNIYDGLRRGCKAAKIPYGQKAKNGFVFHDLRHCFTTNARRAGVARNVIMTIMGHSKGGDMHARYDRIEESDMLAAVDLIEKVFSASVDQNVDHGAKSRK